MKLTSEQKTWQKMAMNGAGDKQADRFVAMLLDLVRETTREAIYWYKAYRQAAVTARHLTGRVMDLQRAIEKLSFTVQLTEIEMKRWQDEAFRLREEQADERK